MATVVGVVIEVDQHGGAPGAGLQQLGKSPHGMPPNHLPVIHRLEKRPQIAEQIDIEMIRPEDRKALEELPGAVDGPE
jgi:hypothetical protein